MAVQQCVCPQCRATLRLPDPLPAGGQVRCTACGTVLRLGTPAPTPAAAAPGRQCTCPRCRSALRLPEPPPDRIKCAVCGTVLQLGPAPQAAVPPRRAPAAVKPARVSSQRPPTRPKTPEARRPARPVVPPPPAASPTPAGRSPLILGIVAGGGVLLGIAVLLIAGLVFSFRNSSLARSTAPAAEPVALAPDRPVSERPGPVPEDPASPSSNKAPRPSLLPPLNLPEEDVSPSPSPSKDPAPPQQKPDPPPRKESESPPPAKPPKPPPRVDDEPPVVRREPVAEDPGPPEEAPPAAKDRPFLALDAGGHSAPVTRVLFTADAQQVISVSMDKTVRIWDVATGETLRIFHLPVGTGDEGALFAAALSPDGTRLAVSGMPVGHGAQGNFIYLFSLESGQVERTFTGHADVVTALAFSHDGRLLASASADGTARVYNLATGQAAHVLQGHRDRVRDVAFSPDDRLLATASHDKTARIWSAAAGTLVAELRPSTALVQSVAWSPDGRTLATGCLEGFIQLWGADGSPQKSYQIAENRKIQPMSLTFFRDGHRLLYTGVEAKGEAGIIDLAEGKRVLDFARHSNTAPHGSLSADGELAVSTGGDNHETYVWKTADGSVVQTFRGAGQSVWGVGWSPDGRTVAWGNTNRGRPDLAAPPLEHTFRLDDLEFGDAPGPEYRRAALTADGWSLESIDFFHVAIKRDGRLLHTFTTPLKGDRIFSFSIVPGDRAVFGGSSVLYLVDLPNNKIVRQFFGNTGNVVAVATSPSGRLFVTGSSDQTLRIWHPDRAEPLLSLFVAGQDWIAWTPEGYYACSPYGERLMGWLVSNGPKAMATFHPAVRFRASLYQPEAIRLVLPLGGVRRALARVGKEHQQPAAAVDVTQVLPPTVAITTPDPATSHQSGAAQVEVKATAESVGQHPVTAMRLLLDGRPYRGDKGVVSFASPRPGKVDASWTVELLSGKHTLAVQAESAVSKAVSSAVEVTRTGQDRDELPALYLLAVGVSEYPGELRLRYAAADAVALSQVFRAKGVGVFRSVEARVVTDRNATRAGILQGLDWLNSVMTAKDVAVFSFSGHGTRDPRGKFYLVPVDVNDHDPAGTCVSGDVIKQALARLPGRVIAVLDACHSGAVADSKRPGSRAAADDLARDLVTEDYGVITMCSSLGNEYSMESSEVGHGFFTEGLMEGLVGKADFNHDGLVYLHEVDTYAALRVRQLSGGQQHPVTGRPATVRSFALSKP